jgi:hypothetical protein
MNRADRRILTFLVCSNAALDYQAIGMTASLFSVLAKGTRPGIMKEVNSVCQPDDQIDTAGRILTHMCPVVGGLTLMSSTLPSW